MKIYDISQEVFSCNVFEGDPVPQKEAIKQIAEGDLYNLTAFSMCAHNGTHIDAPAHFLENGKTVDELSPESFIGSCFVARREGTVTAESAEQICRQAALVDASERILLAGPLTVSEEAAEVFAARGVRLIGNESQTVGPEDAPMRVHTILMQADVVLLEGVVLGNVPEGVYHLSALPLLLGGCEGAPCRAYLTKEEE